MPLRRRSAASLSDERQIETAQFYRKSEATLANFKRARKKPKRSTPNIRAKIAGKLGLQASERSQQRRSLCPTPYSRDGVPRFADLTVGRRP